MWEESYLSDHCRHFENIQNIISARQKERKKFLLLSLFVHVHLFFSLIIKKKNKTKNIQLNPLSPNSDQDQISPNNNHTLSRDKLWEFIKWSHKRKCLDLLSNSLNSFFKEMYGDQFGEFVCGYWGLNG